MCAWGMLQIQILCCLGLPVYEFVLASKQRISMVLFVKKKQNNKRIFQKSLVNGPVVHSPTIFLSNFVTGPWPPSLSVCWLEMVGFSQQPPASWRPARWVHGSRSPSRLDPWSLGPATSCIYSICEVIDQPANTSPGLYTAPRASLCTTYW